MDQWKENESRFGFSQFDDETEGAQREEKRLQETIRFRQSVRRRCSVIGFSLLAFTGIHQLTGFLIVMLYYFLASRDLGAVGQVFFRVLDSDGFLSASSSILSYAMIFPVMALILKRVPKGAVVKRKMRIWKWFMFLILAMGMGYIMNLAGTLIHSLVSLITERSAEDMTPITGVVEDMGWLTVLYISVVAPIAEEIIFRGMILDRIRPYGEKAAILFSAVTFGLMHGNLSQFLYATAIGIVLGYIAVKTGRLRYSIFIHISINSYTTIVVAGLLRRIAENPLLSIAGLTFISAVTLIIMGASLIILGVNIKRTRLKRGDCPDWMEYRDFSGAMYWNVGVAVFIAVSVMMMLFYLFMA